MESGIKSKILVTGSNGQLGSELKELLGSSSSIFFTDVNELDITKRESVERFLFENNIEVIINCAAYTAVDRAEEDEERARIVNAEAPLNLAEAAIAILRAGSSSSGGPLIIHISTDYVFDGKANKPYTEESAVGPTSAYGRTKLEGEEAILNSNCNGIIIRTSWLYSGYGANFVKTINRLSSERDSLDVVFDQVGTPTYAGDLAKAIERVITVWEGASEKERVKLLGIYNFSNEGVCSWFDFATEIVKHSGNNCRVNPVTSDKFVTKAVRPAYSVLDKGKIKRVFGVDIRHWSAPLEEKGLWKKIN